MSGGDWQDDPRYVASLNEPLNEVEPGLYIGSAMARDRVEQHGIRVVVCLTTPLDERHLTILPANVTEHRHYLVDVLRQDMSKLNALLDETTAQIAAAVTGGQPVLVHCGAGVSRSAAVVMDYLMQRRGLTFNAAMRHLEDARYCTCPNPTFQACLHVRARK